MKNKANNSKKSRQKQLMVIYIVTTLLIVLITLLFVNALTSDKEELRDKGIKAYKAGNYTEAVKLFKESLSEKQLFSEKMDLDTRMYLGTAEFKNGNYTEAKATFEKLKDINDGTVDNERIDNMIQFSKAMAGFGEDDPEKLIPSLEKAVENGSRSANIYLAACYYATGDTENMLKAYKAYTDAYGMTNYVAYQLSSYYIREKDYDKANEYITGAPYGSDDLFLPELQYNEILIDENNLDYQTAFDKITALHEKYPDNQEFTKEYDFLYTRININPDPVNKEDVD
ncbi:Tetratricopeptide repeat-containing protein [Eubacterium ruminantium]|nr:Tetratricopeptide repeat-containing protein [Eubacterium ruminantium]